VAELEDLQARVEVLERCLAEIEARLGLRRKGPKKKKRWGRRKPLDVVIPPADPVGSLELPPPIGRPVRNGRPAGPIQR
jgi:hypothetical protein